MPNDVATRAAPSPMPNWPRGSGGNAAASDSKYHPVGPMAKPCTSRTTKPVAPTAISTLARALRPSATTSGAAPRGEGEPERREPSAAVNDDLQQRRGGVLGGEMRHPAQREDAVRQRVPGDARKPTAPTASQTSSGRRGSISGQRIGLVRPASAGERAPSVGPASAGRRLLTAAPDRSPSPSARAVACASRWTRISRNRS